MNHREHLPKIARGFVELRLEFRQLILAPLELRAQTIGFRFGRQSLFSHRCEQCAAFVARGDEPRLALLLRFEFTRCRRTHGAHELVECGGCGGGVCAVHEQGAQ